MDNNKHFETQHLCAIFYDDNGNILMQIKGSNENSLIARASRVLEYFHDAHCDISDCKTHLKIISLKRCGIE